MSVYFTSTSIGYVVGNSGRILKTTTGGVGISEIADNNNTFSIYPNPTTDNLTIDLQKTSNLQNTNIYIYNIQGQLVHQQQITQLKTELNISGLTEGMYVVKVSNNENTMITKIIKN